MEGAAGMESIPKTYPDLLRALFLLKPPALVFGGFAQDALIAGTSRREHGDVDVIVWRDELEARLADFAPLGFESFETHFELQPGRPLVIGATSRTGLSLEPTVLDREGGAPFGDLPAADGIVRVWLTRDIDTHPAVSLDGVTFKCVSPLAQYQLRAALEITGAFGDMRDRDREGQTELRMRYFSDATDDELAPRVELL